MRQKYILIFLFTFGLILTFPKVLFAHPGATASDGCHYCRTNCDKWGVSWNERHCHGGGSAPQRSLESQPTQKPFPTFAPKPTLTLKPTLVPEPTLTIIPSLRPTIEVTLTPTFEPLLKEESQVMGEKVEMKITFWRKILRFLKLSK